MEDERSSTSSQNEFDELKRTKQYRELTKDVIIEYYIPDSMLYGDLYYFTSNWYRMKYPGFPESYYDIFEMYSNFISDVSVGLNEQVPSENDSSIIKIR